MKSILFFINNLGSGGAQRQMVELAKGYKERGHSVRVLIYQENWSEYYWRHLEQSEIQVDSIFEANYLKRIWKIRRYLCRNKFDVVISFLETPSFYMEVASLFVKKWKLIVGERSADPAKKTKLILKVFLHFHILADYVVANSQANIDIIKSITSIIPKKKFRVIYNMYNMEKLSPKSFKTEISEGDKFFNILVASSHRYLKNLNGLVEGVNLLDSQYKNRLRINWYGSNLFDTSLEDAKKKINQYQLNSIFSFHEPTLDIYEHMAKADAVGLFSFFEGLPNAICEAMLLEKPVIVTRISDIPIILKENDNAFLCEADDPITIKNAFVKMLDTPNKQLKLMGVNNRNLALTLFNKEKILADYENLF